MSSSIPTAADVPSKSTASPPPTAARAPHAAASVVEPRLAPPGAGLPFPELLIGRLLFRLRCRRGTAESFTRGFLRERQAIAELLGRCDDQTAAIRVLIARPRGLEDSSRFWSVWMTLDHLRIVHQSIAGVVRSLAAGRVPPGQASTAAVKPAPAVTAAVVEAYERSCDDVLAAFVEAAGRPSPLRYPHPWFGPLNTHGWHAMVGMHMGIHRVQIERILEGLARRERG